MNPESAVDFRRIFESLPEPTLVVALDGPFTLVAMNEAWRKLTGWSSAEHLGRGLGELLGSHATGVLETLETVAHTREQRVLTLPGGVNEDWRLLPGFVHAPDGSLTGLVLRPAGVTEITQLQEEHARELSACRDTWRKIVAHDLAQPIAVMEIGLDLLGEHVPAGEVRVDLERLRRSLSRLKKLIEELPGRVMPAPGSGR